MAKTLVFVVNTAGFFISHRLPIALAAQRQGYRVELISGQTGSAEMEGGAAATLAAAGIVHRQVGFTSAGVNPLREGLAVLAMVRALRQSGADIVHCTTPKGIMYGGLAARLAGVPHLVLAQSGMGYAFTSTGRVSLSRRAIKWVIGRLARIAYGHRDLRVIVQNRDDCASLIAGGLAREDQVTLIPGSGVDLPAYVGADIAAKARVILFPARMLIDKGVTECIAAARRLKASAPDWEFIMAGTADHANPSCIAPEQMKAWHDEGVVNWLGYVADMVPLYARASIVCLPSYREGMPKALLEAAAAGCAVVTTDTTGCREAIIAGETGDLVPVHDSDTLYDALFALINDPERRARYGAAGRARAIRIFSIDAVVAATLGVYQQFARAGESRPAAP